MREKGIPIDKLEIAKGTTIQVECSLLAVAQLFINEFPNPPLYLYPIRLVDLWMK